MTHEQELDYFILKTINEKAFLFKSQLEELGIIYGTNALQISNGLNATYLISREETANHGYGETKTTTSPDNTKISLSKQGKIYLDYLTNEKEKEVVDIKLKKISINSLNTSKRIGFYALAIALITGIVPFIIYFITQNNIVKVDTKTTEVTRLLEIQEYNRKQQKSFQDSVLYYLKTP